MKIRNILHTILAISLGIFFMYAGVKKFIPKPKIQPTEQQIAKMALDKQAQINAIETNNFEKPVAFKLAVGCMSKGGFLKVVGIIQILGGLLLLYNRSRLLGGLILLPIITNIFLLHLILNNSTAENIETGLYFLATLAVIVHYYVRLKELWLENIKHGIMS